MADEKKATATDKVVVTGRPLDDSDRKIDQTGWSDQQKKEYDILSGREPGTTGLEANRHPTPTLAADPTGERSNRVEGTQQAELTPEEYPADAKVAPQMEQLSPNGAALAVGTLAPPEKIGDTKLPDDSEQKVLKSDMSNPSDQLPEDSEQHDAAAKAAAKKEDEQKVS